MKNKRILMSMITVMLALCICFSQTAFAAEATSRTPEVIVEVYVNKNGEDFLRNIEFDDGTCVADYDYEIRYITPTTRDPMYITYYYDAAAWITRDGVVSLSLDPADRVRADSSLKDSAWYVISDPTYGFGDHPQWPTAAANVQTFEWQFDCHFTFANDKDRWNLEPSRTASNYLTVVLNGCNP